MNLYQGNLFQNGQYDAIYFRLVAKDRTELEKQLCDIVGLKTVVLSSSEESERKGYYTLKQVYDLEMHLEERSKNDDY